MKKLLLLGSDGTGALSALSSPNSVVHSGLQAHLEELCKVSESAHLELGRGGWCQTGGNKLVSFWLDHQSRLGDEDKPGCLESVVLEPQEPYGHQ
eukprot:scaffold2989_cov22-Prasinocladus_malaysianus.AAC.1